MKTGDNLGKYSRKLGYILTIGGVLALIAYGLYMLIPEITPYLNKTGLPHRPDRPMWGRADYLRFNN